MSIGSLDFMFFMSNFFVLRKPEIITRQGANSDSAISPAAAFLLLEHKNTWSKRFVNSLIVVLNFLEVKKAAPFVPFIILTFSPILVIGNRSYLYRFIFNVLFRLTCCITVQCPRIAPLTARS